ncbi:MAG: hypothetical protein WDZ28_00175 [Simkaniaceae bacterium]
MDNLAENNQVKFRNVSKKKEAIYANFRVKGVRRGVVFNATISVDLSAAEMDAGKTLETIIEECARIGVKEFQNAEFAFEGIASI